jgi:hypothetical protein
LLKNLSIFFHFKLPLPVHQTGLSPLHWPACNILLRTNSRHLDLLLPQDLFGRGIDWLRREASALSYLLQLPASPLQAAGIACEALFQGSFGRDSQLQSGFSYQQLPQTLVVRVSEV